MKTIEKEQFSRLNKALYNLQEILACVGVKEFSLSKEKHNMQLDTGDIDTDLLYSFCQILEQMHDAKFGRQMAA